MNDEKTNKIMSSEELDDVLPKYEPIKLSGKNLAQNYVSAFNTGMNIYQCVNYLQGNIDWTIKAVNDVVKSWNTEVSESIDQSKAIVRETTTEQFNTEWTNKQPELIEQVNTLTTNQFNEDWGVLENRINTTLETQNTNIQNIQNEQNELETNTNNTVNTQNTKINSIQTQQNNLASNQTNLANQQTTLSNRMDTFTRLSEGSTTGDAELQDIRVGANGTTYDTAGNAVRGQYSQLKEDLDNVISNLLLYKDVSISVKQGYYSKVNGDFYPNNAWNCTELPCVYGERYSVDVYVRGSSVMPVALFKNASGQLIGNTGEISTDSALYNYEIKIPKNATKICITTEVANGNVPFKVRKLDYINLKPLINFKNVDLTGKLTKGYYSAGQVFDNEDWQFATIDCDDGEIFNIDTFIKGSSKFPVAYYFDENDKLVGDSGKYSIDISLYDYEFIIPSGVKRIRVHNYVKNNSVALKISRYSKYKDKYPLHGKRCLFLGDSIVAQEVSWRDTFVDITKVEQVLCTAIAGAHLCDYEDTVLDGTTFTGHGNTICNQVTRILNEKPKDIDIIFIMAGTNDTEISYEELNGDVTQFTEQNVYIDIDTLNRTRIDGSMRWISEKLYTLYPNATIFFATPIQANSQIRWTGRMLAFSDYMKKVGSFLSVPIIDATRRSGIYGRYENYYTNGKYLADGLHPNELGKKKLGKFYASEVLNYFSYL